MDLSTALYRRTVEAPAKPALASPGQTLSYAKLYATAWELGVRLERSLGARDTISAHRFGLLASDPAALIAGYYAGVLGGISVVVLDPSWPDVRLRSVIERLGLEHVVTDAAMDARVAGAVSSVQRHRVTLRQAEADAPPPPSVDPGRELMVVFTSGTTSDPKAIGRSRSSWQASLEVGSRILHASASEVSLVPGPLAHGLSLYAAVEALSAGGTVLLSGGWNTDKVRRLLAARPCTRVVAVPSILRKLLHEVPPELLEELRYVVSGGESLDEALCRRLEALPGASDVVEYYGTSEQSLIAYRSSAHSPKASGAGFTGRPFPSVDIEIGRPSSATGIGEVFVHSPMLATGYLDGAPFRRRAHRLSVQDQGSFCQGVLHLAGRSGGMLNLGGNNVHPGEITEVLSRALGAAESRVLLVPRGAGADRLVAFVLASDLGDRPDPETISELLAAQLPKYKIPHELVALDAWPMTNSGKISTGGLLAQHDHRTAMVLR